MAQVTYHSDEADSAVIRGTKHTLVVTHNGTNYTVSTDDDMCSVDFDIYGDAIDWAKKYADGKPTPYFKRTKRADGSFGHLVPVGAPGETEPPTKGEVIAEVCAKLDVTVVDMPVVKGDFTELKGLPGTEKPGFYQVLCLDDDGNYVPATTQHFNNRLEAEEYAKHTADTRFAKIVHVVTHNEMGDGWPPKIDITGTCLKGYIRANYMDLTRILGQPLRDGDKTQAEWHLELNGKVVTIYDWDAWGPPQIIDFWHIGCRDGDEEVVYLVKELLA